MQLEKAMKSKQQFIQIFTCDKKKKYWKYRHTSGKQIETNLKWHFLLIWWLMCSIHCFLLPSNRTQLDIGDQIWPHTQKKTWTFQMDCRIQSWEERSVFSNKALWNTIHISNVCPTACSFTNYNNCPSGSADMAQQTPPQAACMKETCSRMWYASAYLVSSDGQGFQLIQCLLDLRCIIMFGMLSVTIHQVWEFAIDFDSFSRVLYLWLRTS